MNIALIGAALPPQMDGIGDHSAQLAAQLAKIGYGVRVLTARDRTHAPIAGAVIIPAFEPKRPRSVLDLAGHASTAAGGSPDWVLLQYNPFSYGRWGLNPFLPIAIDRVLRRCRGARFALMVHEPFVWAHSAKSAVMSAYQRAQLRALGRLADVVFFSTETWTSEFAGWFGRTPVRHLPVGSNVPRVPITREAARTARGIPPQALILGLFGSVQRARLLDQVRAAAEACAAHGRDVRLLYVGPHGARVREAVGDAVPLVDAGTLPPDDVSRWFAAMDVYLAPYIDGASTRRTSLMTGLQHGVATVTTRGHATDPILLAQDGRALLLADAAGAPDGFACQALRLAESATLRDDVGERARRLYEDHFAWERVAGRLRQSFEEPSAWKR